MRRRLSPDLQLAVTIAYTYGWRMQSEVLALARRQLDLEAGTLRLDPGTAKNDNGRLVYLSPELKALLGAQVEPIRAVERKTDRIIPTSSRSSTDAGVPERVAMKVTGHRTCAVFDRYHIVSPGDLQDVARKLAGTFSGTSEGVGLTCVPQVCKFTGADD